MGADSAEKINSFTLSDGLDILTHLLDRVIIISIDSATSVLFGLLVVMATWPWYSLL